MKKNRKFRKYRIDIIPKQLWMRMKLTLLFSLFVLSSVMASNAFTQKKVTLNVDQATLNDLFQRLREQTGDMIVFNSADLNPNQLVSVKCKDKSVLELLNEVLAGKNLSYEVVNDYIVVHRTDKPSPQQQQQPTRRTVTGKVLDMTELPIPGVAILVKGSPRGVTTDMDGTFSINVTNNDVLLFSFIGMEGQEIPVGTQKELLIHLKEKSDQLDEVMVVAFGKQKKESVVASVTTIKPEELRVPSSNLTTAFAGRLAGVISYQRTGEPGKDNAEFFIRGVTTFGTGKNNPLILIDGVEMSTDDLARLTTDDIASFSIMKDANATALYGARGANGVILVNTKEGKEGKMRISLRMEASYSAPTENIEVADPVTYMKMHNEAVRTRNPLAALPYSTSKIVNTEKGTNPLYYPAVNWMDMLFNDHTFNQRYNLNVSGGGKVARYYVAASYSRDNGIIKMDKRNNFNNNIAINRYVLRSNVNINLTKSTEMIVRLHGAFDDYSGPLDGGSELYAKALRSNPVLFLPYYPADKANAYTEHILFGNYDQGNYQNPYADMVKGYKTSDRTNMLAQFELKQKLDFVTKGLSARGMFNVTRYSLLDAKESYVPFFYSLSMLADSDDYKLSALNPNDGKDYLVHTPASKELTSTMYVEAAIQYNRLFAENHNISGMLVYTLRESINGNASDLQASLPHRNLGLAGRFTYGYANRYFVEFNFGYNGSERFAQQERFGFFPSVGAGWVVSNEKFMEPYRHVLTKLKLKGTYGLVGNDQIGEDKDRFFYLSNVNMDDSGRGMSFGDEFTYNRPGVSISRYADPTITWEISHKTNWGLEMNFFDNLEFQFDYYTEKRTKILQERADIPSTMGLQATPRSNVGKAQGHGLEFSVDYNKSFNKDLWTAIRGNFTYATSKYDVFEEPDYSATPWKFHKGQKLSQEWGLVAERLFLDEEEVKNSPKQMFGEYAAGDIKYKDINGDMVIDERDQVPIGFPTRPEIIYGFGLSAGYKGFDISCFFQGSGRSSLWIDPQATAPFIGGTSPHALLKYYADDHWTEESKNIYALWPRLSDKEMTNNQAKSTWFMRDGTFLRLKTIELGYTLPQRWTQQAAMSKVRLYVTGNNLACWSKFKMWDPEMGGKGLSYPLQRVFNFGINIDF